jgi:general secretion pathway protein K
MNLLKKNQNGMALMIVLWVLVLLSALATEFAIAMRTEVRTTRNHKEDTESYYLAKAGIHLAMAELYKTAKYHAYTEEYGFIVGNPPPPVKAQGQQFTEAIAEFDVILRQNISLGNGIVSYTIIDENRKINLNTADPVLLNKALEYSGVTDANLRSIIADSILDWIDADDNHRVNGAESDYYLTLPQPYRAKNDKFEDVDELIYVRGMTEEILYGSSDGTATSDANAALRGIAQYFTVENIPHVNPNTAGPEILAIVYNETQMQEMMKKRAESGGFLNVVSTHFRIIATGKMNDSNTRHTITAMIEKFGNDAKATLMTRHWKDNTLDYE